MTLRSIVAAALAEDIGRGDVTSESTVPASTRALGRLVARQKAVVAGLDVAREVFKQVGGVAWRARSKDGDRIRSGQVVAAISVSGPVERLGRRPGPRFAPLVTAAAAALSARL